MIKKNYIPVVTPAECRRVYLEEILYIEFSYRKVEIHTLKNQYSFYDKIVNLEKYLDERFFPCLKFLIVNFDMVVSMKDGKIHLVGGEELIIGQHNFIHAKQRYAYYIRTQQDIKRMRSENYNIKVSEETKKFNGNL